MSTYRRNNSAGTTIEMLRFLAEQRDPVSGKAVADALRMPYGTTMGYLATLDDCGMVRKIGDAYELGMGMAMFWAKTKARKEAERQRIADDLAALEGEEI